MMAAAVPVVRVTAELLVECDLPESLDAIALHDAAGRAVAAAGVPSDAHLTVSLVDSARMAELKLQAFGVHHATDVLAFGVDDPRDPGPGPFVLGDVFVCPEVAVRQARALGVPPLHEVTTLIAHGVLHLLGHAHGTPDDERAMVRAQDRVREEALA